MLFHLLCQWKFPKSIISCTTNVSGIYLHHLSDVMNVSKIFAPLLKCQECLWNWCLFVQLSWVSLNFKFVSPHCGAMDVFAEFICTSFRHHGCFWMFPRVDFKRLGHYSWLPSNLSCQIILDKLKSNLCSRYSSNHRLETSQTNPALQSPWINSRQSCH